VIIHDLVLLRRVIRSIRNSTLSLVSFKSMIALKNLPELKPILDVAARWNSTAEIIARASAAIDFYAADHDSKVPIKKKETSCFNLDYSIWERAKKFLIIAATIA
jgi:hypothetical protein